MEKNTKMKWKYDPWISYLTYITKFDKIEVLPRACRALPLSRTPCSRVQGSVSSSVWSVGVESGSTSCCHLEQTHTLSSGLIVSSCSLLSSQRPSLTWTLRGLVTVSTPPWIYYILLLFCLFIFSALFLIFTNFFPSFNLLLICFLN